MTGAFFKLNPKGAAPPSIMDLFTIIFLCIFAPLMFWIFGFIGTKRQKEFFRKSFTWAWKDAPLLFPIDPYKPLPEAFKDMTPTPAKLKGALFWMAIVIGGTFLLGLLAGLFVSVSR